MGGRRRGMAGAGYALAVGGSAAVVVSSFLAWGGSGAADRSSYELLRSAERLDLLGGSARGAARVVWHLVPAAAAAAWIAAMLRRPMLTALLVLLIAGAAGGAAAVVAASPLKVRVGVPMAVLAGALGVAGAALLFADAWRRDDRYDRAG